jgi:D-cysteine desulfhydrase/L-cysteate sulfo-lyase
LGLKPLLVLFKTYDLPEEVDGNVLLDFILDAEIQIREARRGKIISEEEVAEIIEEVRLKVLEWGHKPYVAPIGGSIPGFSMELPLGGIAYVKAGMEIFEQLAEERVKPTWIVHASGSGGTQAGLVVAAKVLSPETKVLGICVSDTREKFLPEVSLVAQETVKALDLEITITEEDIILLDDYLGEGYGILTPEIARTVRLVAQREGIFLDPVYTGKAMWALLDLIDRGYFKPHDRIVFVHTGGTAALFPHRQGFQSFLT